MSLWQIYSSNRPLGGVPPSYSATLEYLATEFTWDFSQSNPGSVDYMGDGEFHISANTNDNPENSNFHAKFYFDLHYDGPTIVYPLSIILGATLQHVDGQMYSYNYGSPDTADFFTFNESAGSGTPPYTKYGHTMYDLWGGATPLMNYYNLETKDWDICGHRSIDTNTDWWFVLDFDYTQCVVDSHFKLQTLWYRYNNPPDFTNHHYILLTEP